MRDDLIKRRDRTWDLLIVKGLDYGKVVEQVSNDFDVKPNTIEKDISRMDDWLPELNELSPKSGYSRLMEIRQNRQRLQQMAIEARGEDDPHLELKIRRQIDSAIEKDVTLSQSLGISPMEPQKQEISGPDGSSIKFESDNRSKVDLELDEEDYEFFDQAFGGIDDDIAFAPEDTDDDGPEFEHDEIEDVE